MAFPWGGMENPCLTFVSPVLVVGDKSLSNVIAHEISHSWTGNGVTNQDWGNLWVNEGFTVFLERKIIELVYGEDMMLLEAVKGEKGLEVQIKSYGLENNYSKLHPDFTDVYFILKIRSTQTMVSLWFLMKRDSYSYITCSL